MSPFVFMGINLLIVEADGLFRLNLSRRLRLQRYRVFEAEQQADARKILERKKIDVVLLGLNGLKRQGLLLLERIKKIRPLTEVIIINTSEYLSLSIEGMKLGAFDDVFLPLNMDSLAERIQEAYRLKKKNEKTKKSLLRRYQDVMVAATFAEAGEPDIAREFLPKEKGLPTGATTSRTKAS
ncbi:MAG: response regulator [Pseudomonadota bacterium]